MSRFHCRSPRPLGSGARRWTAGTRTRFANDLVDRRALAAVTDNVNQSKGDSGPAQWLPRFQRCRYVRECTAVKLRWSLRVNASEHRALLRVADRCDNVVVRWRPADIRRSGGGGNGGGTDPRFDYCYQAIEAGYGPYYRGRDDEYWWYDDADDDGVVCES